MNFLMNKYAHIMNNYAMNNYAHIMHIYSKMPQVMRILFHMLLIIFKII